MSAPIPAPARGAVVALIAALVVLAVTLRLITVAQSDFAAFYASAVAMSAGAAPPFDEFPNLNPPTFALLLRPLTWMPLNVAFVVWTLLGASIVVWAVASVWHRHPAIRGRGWYALALCIGSVPALYAWSLGQVTWLLLVPSMCAWLAATDARAGGWLGAIVAVKPTFGLVALVLPWRVGMWTAASAAAITGAAVVATGLAAWHEWLALESRIWWIGYQQNLSLWGIAARLHGERATMSDIFWPAAVPIGIVALAAAAWIVRQERNLRWLWAFWGSLLVMPLGWMFYLPLALGPALVVWRTNAWTTAAVVILAVPPAIWWTVLPRVPGGSFVAGALGAVALGLLWIGLRPTSRTTRRPRLSS